MTAKCFFDTNILVYTLDPRAVEKRRTAQDILRSATTRAAAALSTQVLQELFVVVTNKLSILEVDSAIAVLNHFAVLPIVQVRTEMILEASRRVARDQLSFWDALIVEAALEGGCTVLYSEDFQDGRRFGALTVVNPFHKK